MRDWADDVAAQIMVAAYASPTPRDTIAKIARIIYERGEKNGRDESKRTFERFLHGQKS